MFALMERVNSDMEKVKVIADTAGLDFPDVGLAPPRSGVNVPRVGRTITDSLHHSSAQNMFPVPDISEFLDILPDDEARRALKQVFETYRGSVKDQFVKLYDVTSSSLNAADDWLIFYSE